MGELARSDLYPDETRMQPPANAPGGMTPEDWMLSGQRPPEATYDYVRPQSWAEKAHDLTTRDIANYQTGGTPAMMGALAADSSQEQDLAGGFAAGGIIKGVGPGGILKPDPLWSPISKTKLEKPLSEMEHGYTDQRFPVPQIVDPQKLQGGYGVFTPSDLSRGNVTVNKIDTVPIDPVTAHGGVSFPEANPGMAWASETPIARKLDNQAAALAEKGKPVYIMPMTMSPQGIDASHHVADPLAQLVRDAPIAKTNVEKFDRMMRKADSDWPGIKDDDFREYINNLQGGMKIKAYMADRMALGAWQDKGFPSVAAVRHAMSEPALIDAPRNTTGMAISQYTPGQGLLETSHPSYSKGVAGQYMGQLASLLPFDVAAPTISRGLARVNAQNLAAGKEVAITPRYHLEKPTPGVPTYQEFNQQWLDRVMERERKLAKAREDQ